MLSDNGSPAPNGYIAMGRGNRNRKCNGLRLGLVNLSGALLLVFFGAEPVCGAEDLSAPCRTSAALSRTGTPSTFQIARRGMSKTSKALVGSDSLTGGL